MVTNFTKMLLNEVASKLKMNIVRVTRTRELYVSLTFKLAQMVVVAVVGGVMKSFNRAIEGHKYIADDVLSDFMTPYIRKKMVALLH